MVATATFAFTFASSLAHAVRGAPEGLPAALGAEAGGDDCSGDFVNPSDAYFEALLPVGLLQVGAELQRADLRPRLESHGSQGSGDGEELSQQLQQPLWPPMAGLAAGVLGNAVSNPSDMPLAPGQTSPDLGSLVDSVIAANHALQDAVNNMDGAPGQGPLGVAGVVGSVVQGVAAASPTVLFNVLIDNAFEKLKNMTRELGEKAADGRDAIMQKVNSAEASLREKLEVFESKATQAVDLYLQLWGSATVAAESLHESIEALSSSADLGAGGAALKAKFATILQGAKGLAARLQSISVHVKGLGQATLLAAKPKLSKIQQAARALYSNATAFSWAFQASIDDIMTGLENGLRARAGLFDGARQAAAVVDSYATHAAQDCAQGIIDATDSLISQMPEPEPEQQQPAQSKATPSAAARAHTFGALLFLLGLSHRGWAWTASDN